MTRSCLLYLTRCFAALAMLTSPVAVMAEELHIDIERIEQCLQFHTDAYQCVGLAAGACSELPRGDSIFGMTTCVQKERAYWLERTEAALDDLARMSAEIDQQYGSGASIAPATAAMQRSWIDFRDAICEVRLDLFDDGKLRRDLCLMEFDGEQAIYLIGLMERQFAWLP